MDYLILGLIAFLILFPLMIALKRQRENFVGLPGKRNLEQIATRLTPTNSPKLTSLLSILNQSLTINTLSSKAVSMGVLQVATISTPNRESITIARQASSAGGIDNDILMIATSDAAYWVRTNNFSRRYYRNDEMIAKMYRGPLAEFWLLRWWYKSNLKLTNGEEINAGKSGKITSEVSSTNLSPDSATASADLFFEEAKTGKPILSLKMNGGYRIESSPSASQQSLEVSTITALEAMLSTLPKERFV